VTTIYVALWIVAAVLATWVICSVLAWFGSPDPELEYRRGFADGYRAHGAGAREHELPHLIRAQLASSCVLPHPYPPRGPDRSEPGDEPDVYRTPESRLRLTRTAGWQDGFGPEYNPQRWKAGGA